MGLFASFYEHFMGQITNGGREGYFVWNFNDLTIMGAINMVLWPKLAVFASKWSTFSTQIANRGEGDLIMGKIQRLSNYVCVFP